MNFKQATDAICMPVSHDDVASALGVSVQTVRQARMDDEATAKRAPPKDWRRAVIRLAERRIMHYRDLIARLRGEETNK